MAKILKFPTGEEITTPKDAMIADSNKCVATSKFLMDVLEEFIVTGQASDDDTFNNMVFREQIFQESRDMFVVVNMLNGMFNRYLGIPHVMHKSMDKAYYLIHKAIEDNEKAQRKLNEIMDEDDTT